MSDRPTDTHRTRITAVDVDSGESETIEIGPDAFLVICGPGRYTAHENIHANGTNVVTIKTHRWIEER